MTVKNDKQLNIRIETTSHQKMKQKARDCNMTLSEFIKLNSIDNSILEKLNRLFETGAETIRLLKMLIHEQEKTRGLIQGKKGEENEES